MSNEKQDTPKSQQTQRLTSEQAWKAIEVMRLMSHADHRVKLTPITMALDLCRDAALDLDPGEPAEVLIAKAVNILEGLVAAELMFAEYRRRNDEMKAGLQ